MEKTITTILKDDEALVADTPGGIYAYTELGRVGITRETMPQAYDDDGYVLPLLVIKARAPVPTSGMSDEVEQRTAILQYIECWMYQWVGYDRIEIIDNHLYRIMQYRKIQGFTNFAWNFSTGPQQDNGSLNGASVMMKDFMIRSVKKPMVIDDSELDMKWRGQWAAGNYNYNEVVRDGEWTMIVVNPNGTSDRAAPVPDVVSAWKKPDAPVWTTVNSTITELWVGHRLIPAQSAYINSVRYWDKSGNSPTLFFDILLRLDKGTSDERTVRLAEHQPPATGAAGWIVVPLALPVFIEKGRRVDVILVIHDTNSYVSLPNFWASDPTAQGFTYDPNTGTETLSEDGFGIDLNTSIAIESPDWDTVAFSSG